jgi:hypothetical protein
MTDDLSDAGCGAGFPGAGFRLGQTDGGAA